MATPTRPVITRAEERPREAWDDPARAGTSWFTLFSGDITPTAGLSAGIAEIAPGNALVLHRHAEAELYLILDGTGLLSIDGQESALSAGAAVYIPGDAEHGLRNTGETVLRLFYVFPTDRFGDVVYRFSGAEEAPAPTT